MASQQLSSLSLDDTNYVMVAAIDFGTTFSGYAFSFKNDPDTIRMNKSWGENVGFQGYKTPTCVLTSGTHPEKFEAFGYEAEDRYAEVEEDNDEKEDLHLYKHFKMMLHSEGKLTRNTKLCSADGKITPAIDVFAMALKYLKNHLIEAVKKTVKRLDESLIKWILTVPAIWREEAKQFMREAAVQAGVITSKDSKQLSVCLEPEAASILCRNLELNHFVEGFGNKDATFRKGTKYILVDAGGGTIDITVHEVLDTGNVKEIHRATGGPWGSTKVDENFVKLLENILGKNFITAFKKERPRQWFLFMVNFEKMKRAVKPDGKSKINITLPWDMRDMYQNKIGKSLDKVIKDQSDMGVGFSNGIFIVKPNAVQGLFQHVLNDIDTHLQQLMTKPQVADCKYILLVGGFAESAYLQQAINGLCKGKMKVLVPSDAQMAVIKGAVLFGHKPESIEARIARKTYGCKIAPKYDPSQHDKKYTYTDREGQLRCDMFDVYVRKDEEIKIGETRSFTHLPAFADQKSATIEIKCSYRTNVIYANEEEVDTIGSITVEMPNTEKGLDRKIGMELTFGGTEIEIHATDTSSGCTANTVIDFLAG